MSQNNLKFNIFLMSATFLALVGGYGVTKLYDKLKKRIPEISEISETVIPIYQEPLSFKATKPTPAIIPSPKKNEIEKLVIAYNNLQRQAMNTRDKFHQKLATTLMEIEEIREEIYNFECQSSIKLHRILEEIEICNNLHSDSKELANYIASLRTKATEEEEVKIETLELMQIELGLLIRKYLELEEREMRAWHKALIDIKRVQSQLARATNWALQLSKKRSMKR
ncbi:7123_t:CDS:1 [Cetraspora pellucida]|uniref:7123_t:CDS:1 n=2 Tax=Cetraspora pellucida TaxID=1433469 RepID=A0A9N9CJN3_9GLOM|nr:7123_t:CDS:1 [Cetraspora pellucida]